MLPELSGIELCVEIKKHPELHDTKLILFTGNEDEETRNTALLSGADEVVIKSSDAQKIIKIHGYCRVNDLNLSAFRLCA